MLLNSTDVYLLLLPRVLLYLLAHPHVRALISCSTLVVTPVRVIVRVVVSTLVRTRAYSSAYASAYSSKSSS